MPGRDRLERKADVNGMLLVSTDDWRDDQEAEIIATGIIPAS